MNRKHKAYLKLNVMSLFFIGISFISVTLAWFAYSGIARVSTEIDVKSWLIEFEKNDSTVSNDIVLSLSEIYPGMETIHESVKITNKGDSNASLSYSIASVRILDDDLSIDEIDNDYLKDKLSHDYPFNININLSDSFVLSNGGESVFDMSISWPLDSSNDELDSNWGNLAYQFGISEKEKYNNDSSYKIRPSIKVVISVKAEQITLSDTSSDVNYKLGDVILYDVVNNTRCEALSDSCIRTHIIDINNKVGDNTVSLLPTFLGSYSSGSYTDYDSLLSSVINNWSVDTRSLEINDIMNIISNDVVSSFAIRENLSDSIVGYVNYGDRINNIISDTVLYNGYFSFLNSKFDYLVTNKCYWLNKVYDDNKSFAITKYDDERSLIYGEDNSSNCSVVPIIIAPKEKLIINNE